MKDTTRRLVFVVSLLILSKALLVHIEASKPLYEENDKVSMSVMGAIEKLYAYNPILTSNYLRLLGKEQEAENTKAKARAWENLVTSNPALAENYRREVNKLFVVTRNITISNFKFFVLMSSLSALALIEFFYLIEGILSFLPRMRSKKAKEPETALELEGI
jgi:hypothetical protein